ncbi:MAG TPA: hypothetical protein EYN67_00740 [Flavobacteriales bacterium]|nr:hypothetical protein [Flavobacteriales bacterium]
MNDTQSLVKAIQKVQATSADNYDGFDGVRPNQRITNYLNAVDDLRDLLLSTFSERELGRLTELLIDMQSDSLSVFDMDGNEIPKTIESFLLDDLI